MEARLAKSRIKTTETKRTVIYGLQFLMRASSFFCHTYLCSLGPQSWNLQIPIKSNQFQAEGSLKALMTLTASCCFSW